MAEDRMPSIVDVHVLFTNGKGECLFLRRANTDYKDGEFSVVAGHLEPNESIEECAIRESAEEVGVLIDIKDLKFINVMRRDAWGNRISFFFQCEHWTGDIKNNEPTKCSELTWRGVDQLPEPMVDYVAAAIQSTRAGKILSDYSSD